MGWFSLVSTAGSSDRAFGRSCNQYWHCLEIISQNKTCVRVKPVKTGKICRTLSEGGQQK
jgi:hypothetical protein